MARELAQSKRKRSSEGASTSSDAVELKRTEKFRRVRRGERCGHCATCTNPKSKKACLTIRAKWEREVEIEEEEEAAQNTARDNAQKLLQASKNGDDKALRVTDNFGLASIEQTDKLLKSLKKNQDVLAHVFLLTKMISRSDLKVMEKLMHSEGFLCTLSQILSKALDDKYILKAKSILSLLLKLPFSMDKVIKKEVAEVLASLSKGKKHEEEDLANLSKRVFSTWKGKARADSQKKEDDGSKLSKAPLAGPAPDSPKGDANSDSQDVTAIDEKKEKVAKEAAMPVKAHEPPPKPTGEVKTVTTVAMQGRGRSPVSEPPATSGKVDGKVDGEPVKKRTKRKMRVSWKPDDYLCTFYEIPSREMNKRAAKKFKAMEKEHKKEERSEGAVLHTALAQKRVEEREKMQAWKARISWMNPRKLTEASMKLRSGEINSKELQRLQERNAQRSNTSKAKYGSSPKEPEKALSPALANQLKNLLGSKDLLRNINNIAMQGGAPSLQVQRTSQQRMHPMPVHQPLGMRAGPPAVVGPQVQSSIQQLRTTAPTLRPSAPQGAGPYTPSSQGMNMIPSWPPPRSSGMVPFQGQHLAGPQPIVSAPMQGQQQQYPYPILQPQAQGSLFPGQTRWGPPYSNVNQQRDSAVTGHQNRYQHQQRKM
mmetsp:Transcript_9492/g.28846  ORF Transcript_9492/g.28846 Transcript_9492/m.28846 type:complete len:652 (+) Transcript_9492:342-2297(+)|eukprot:CAMPEP_0198475712 /NCGR_PEP_ID=MMETSP1456-20131121/40946_1 /TAXON_ID=1461544 ORGANISM="Unidentified sp., Strain RCC1871" /NCGR_SAMPLE_ID=MMETSP1456 /ASSEMBLY_ACC=CAM_ASM_001119 /LENGTH=651 /DNA_ID=CAMNT_0044202413 /DNA_START=332 /DNA_END=2287 /DNA_ORIENTATION=-